MNLSLIGRITPHSGVYCSFAYQNNGCIILRIFRRDVVVGSLYQYCNHKYLGEVVDHTF